MAALDSPSRSFSGEFRLSFEPVDLELNSSSLLPQPRKVDGELQLELWKDWSYYTSSLPQPRSLLPLRSSTLSSLEFLVVAELSLSLFDLQRAFLSGRPLYLFPASTLPLTQGNILKLLQSPICSGNKDERMNVKALFAVPFA